MQKTFACRLSRRLWLWVVLSLLASAALPAQHALVASRAGGADAFSLSAGTIHYDEGDFAVVRHTARLLAQDIASVTGRRPFVTTSTPSGDVIILGTLGHSNLLDRLVADSKIDVSAIAGGWERFTIQRVSNPFPGIDRALVIAGSDRRGAAYGAFTLSEAMGVSPWAWWADVPVAHRPSLYVVGDTISRAPSIKYRGLFLNDEDWGLQPWSAGNFEKELGDIGPKTYARVFELVLRLRGNMVAPAMHSCTGAFYSYPESKEVADEYGIVITTAHCEPLLFNNAAKSEWDSERDGEWNYATNRSVILDKLDHRVGEAHQYENIYTIGMRGLHDEGMRGGHGPERKVELLAQAMTDQRAILEKYTGDPAADVPQIFVPYKETMELYERGLEVPDDVTLVWVDDNYGYLKRLSDPAEQQRSGGAGVYYHLSYLGPPHDYLWLNTTPPVLMYEELQKAYDNGADRYWLLNVGDIKPMELGMQTFFDYAWDVEGFDYETVHRHQATVLARLFPTEQEEVLQDILDTYYRLAWSRKPEYMGWEREWDEDASLRQLGNTQYSFEHYNDARQRLADYQRIARLAKDIHDSLPAAYRPAFYELVAYPVLGAEQMNRKFLLAQLNDERAAAGDFPAANWAAGQARMAFDSLHRLTEFYNTMLDGKWQGMMQLAPGLTAKYQNMPEVKQTPGTGSRPVDLSPQPAQQQLEGATVLRLGDFAVERAAGYTIRTIDGIGYDWKSLQLGEADQPTAEAESLEGPAVTFDFSSGLADSLTVYVYTLPTFPVHGGRTNAYGISVDGHPPVVVNNEPVEFSREWKDQVLQNGAVARVTFPVSPATTHSLSLTIGDPGIIVQRIVIDWGGLQDTYVGPSSELNGSAGK